MAIIAKADITISRIVDVKSVTTYYLLQSSTAAKPSKPTAIPPGGNWKTMEPTYESGSTSTLYTVILTVMSNDTYIYSDVSKSSSYEAAKEAWNKANHAQSAADDAAKVATNYIEGTGDGLIVGKMDSQTLGANVKVGADAMEIRKGDTVLARYAADKVELGRNSRNAVLELCGGTATISSAKKNVNGKEVTFSKIGGTDGAALEASSYLDIRAEDAVNMSTSKTYKDGNDDCISESIFSMISPEINAEQDAVSFLEYVGNYTSPGGSKDVQNYIAVSNEGILLSTVKGHVSDNNKVSLVLNNIDGKVYVRSTGTLSVMSNITGYGIGVGVGTGGVNRGLYDHVADKWQIYSTEKDLYLGPPARESYKPYYTAGDKIPCEINTGGYVTENGTIVRFVIPLCKPLVGVTKAILSSRDGFKGRQGGKYTHGSSGSKYVKPSSYGCYIREGWIDVRMTFSSTANAVTNDAVGVTWSGYVTFS